MSYGRQTKPHKSRNESIEQTIKRMERINLEKLYRVVGKAIVGSLGLSVVLFFTRILGVAIVWFGAKVLQWIFGGFITNGLNELFGTTRFAPNEIPAILVVLYLFGSYLVTTTQVKSER